MENNNIPEDRQLKNRLYENTGQIECCWCHKLARKIIIVGKQQHSEDRHWKNQLFGTTIHKAEWVLLWHKLIGAQIKHRGIQQHSEDRRWKNRLLTGEEYVFASVYVQYFLKMVFYYCNLEGSGLPIVFNFIAIPVNQKQNDYRVRNQPSIYTIKCLALSSMLIYYADSEYNCTYNIHSLYPHL